MMQLVVVEAIKVYKDEQARVSRFMIMYCPPLFVCIVICHFGTCIEVVGK